MKIRAIRSLIAAVLLGCLAQCGTDNGETGSEVEEIGRVGQGLCVQQTLTPTGATASSVEAAQFGPALAIDGNTSTRWSSAFSDPQWIAVDLGARRQISRVVLNWEAAASKSYQIQVSDNSAGPWTTVFTDTNGNGGIDTISGLNALGRFVRMFSSLRTTTFGNSLFEFTISGDPNPNCGAAGATCGNGIVEAGEGCDDGNTASGDGCSSTCQFEACGSAKLVPTAATASSTESASFPASEAINGIIQTGCNAADRWSSAFSDPQWLNIDLGSVSHINRVVLYWECAASANYDIQVATNATGPWSTVYTDTAGNGGTDDITGLTATGRYVRVFSRARTTTFGTSLYEVEVFGDRNAQCGGGACTNPSATNSTPLTIRQSNIGARQILANVSNGVRMGQNPVTKKIHFITIAGDVFALNVAAGTGSTSTQITTGAAIASAIGKSLTTVQGMAFGPEGNLYLVANSTSGNTNTAVIIRGTPNGSSWNWSTLATSDPYPNSNTPFDHHWNGVVVSPDGLSVYVASGSRTDHGEVQNVGGAFPNARDVPLTAAMFRLPSNGANILLRNDRTTLVNAGYLFAEGLRNSFDPAFAPDGKLVSADNGPDADYNEEFNWIRQGMHFGFPWRLGNEDNAMQFPNYDPATDKRLQPGYFGVQNGFYHNDPSFPPKPAGLVDPIVSRGPDADQFRNLSTGGVSEASALGLKMSTFTGHRSPLGLSYDVGGTLCRDFKQSAFLLSYGSAAVAFPDAGQDLLYLRAIPVGTTFELETRQLITGFAHPIDSVLVGNKLYVIEFGTPGHIWEISLPLSG